MSLLHKDSENGNDDLENFETPICLSEIVAESMWIVGWMCDQRPNAVLDYFKHAFAWRSTVWWRRAKASDIDDGSQHSHKSTLAHVTAEGDECTLAFCVLHCVVAILSLL